MILSEGAWNFVLFSIHNTAGVSLESWPLCCNFKCPPVNPLHKHFGLTLRSYIYFINDKTCEMQMKMFINFVHQMQGSSHDAILNMWGFYCCSYFAWISLRLVVIITRTFSPNGHLCTAGLIWYTLKVHIWIPVKCTWWNGHWSVNCLLEHNGDAMQTGLYFIYKPTWDDYVPRIIVFKIFSFLFSIWS